MKIGTSWIASARFERNWRDVWVGVYWRRLSSLGYEIDPRFPVRHMKSGTPYQIERFDLWLCVIPCFPLHVSAWRPWRDGHWVDETSERAS